MRTKTRIAKAVSIELDFPLGTDMANEHLRREFFAVEITTTASEYTSESAALEVKYLNLT